MASFLFHLCLVYGQHRVLFLPPATPCLSVATRGKFQGVVMGTMGGAQDTARTNRENGGTRRPLAKIYTRRLHTAFLGRVYGPAGRRRKPPGRGVPR